MPSHGVSSHVHGAASTSTPPEDELIFQSVPKEWLLARVQASGPYKNLVQSGNARGSVQMARIFLSCVRPLKWSVRS